MFRSFFIHKQATLRDALISMTTHRKGILFVIESSDHLLGVLSDGDIRRALLQGISLESPIEQWMNLNPVKALSVQEGREILEKRPSLLAIPIIESAGKICEVCVIDPYGKITVWSEAPPSSNDINAINYLAIIPARGGSKRIPRKNLSKLGKDSLLGLAIKCAQETPEIESIIVSTDDAEIAEEAARYGVVVEWMRSLELSRDDTKTIDVLKFELTEFIKRKSIHPKHCVLLEPTSPLRTPKMLSSAIQYFKANHAESLVSVTPLRHNFHPEEVLRINGKFLSPYLLNRTMDSRLGRQQQEPLYVQNGILYITKSEIILDKGSIYGDIILAFDTGEDSYLDIDNLDDLELAKFKFNKSL